MSADGLAGLGFVGWLGSSRPQLISPDLLAGGRDDPSHPSCGSDRATVTHNDSGHFESHWVRLAPSVGNCPFLDDSGPIELPVAHGEGKFLTADESTLARLQESGQIVMRYVDARMPHHERYVDPLHHPRWTRRGSETGADGLRICRNAVTALS